MMEGEKTSVPAVYGQLNGQLVVLPVTDALRLARAHSAVESARTWGEFRNLAPEGYGEVMVCVREDPEGWWPELFPTLLPGQEPPTHLPLDTRALPGVEDGDWPSWPQREMLVVLPASLVERYGQVLATVLNGDVAAIPWAHAEVVKAELARSGWTLQRNDTLMEAASGLLAGDAARVAVKSQQTA